MTKVITGEDKLSCAQRELRLRRKVYPRWVQIGKMDASDAAREIATMEAIVKDYQHHLRQKEMFGDLDQPLGNV
jgi:hypothetical protein